MAKVAYCGMGNMGSPMAINLLKAGNEVTVWNRTASKCDAAKAEGAAVADTPKAAAAAADFTFICVADGPTLKKVAMGEDGVCAGIKAGDIVINMSTVAPAESQEVADAVAAAGGKYLRCPVTGFTALAVAAKIGVLGSGDKDAYDKALPLLQTVGAGQWYLGDGEQATVLKLCINTMIASEMQLEAEAVVLAEKAGLDVAQTCDIIAGSAAGSPLCGYKAKLIATEAYEPPAFAVKLMIKDLDLALAAARQYGVPMPATALTRQQLGAAEAQGYGGADFAVLTKVLEKASNYER